MAEESPKAPVEWGMKHIATTSIISIGTALIGIITIWTFLQTQFAPAKLTDHQLQRYEERIKKLEKDNQDLRIYFEQLKKSQ